MCNKIVTFVKLKSKPRKFKTTPRKQPNNTPKTTKQHPETNETAPPIGKRISKEHIKQIKKRKMKTVYDFSVKDRKGKSVSLKEYANEVLLIVNTAIKCGFTPQYEELEKLYEKYHAQGFEVLDFPCNQFGAQAPGTDESIHQFCKLTYNTEFPRFKKVKVNGDDADDLFKFLKEQKSFAGFDPAHKLTPVLEEMLAKDAPDYKETADIKWNFTKFLVNKRGMVVARFEPTESLDNIAKQIEEII